MIYYISAQPDDLYFRWQLEVQLHNFHAKGIAAEQIHVLIVYSGYKGVNPIFREFVDANAHKARFFFYEDTRVNSNYIPSIRPHALKKHFTVHAYLNDACIFYHDSDIIFRELPDFERLCQGENWYVSDATSYVSVDYINEIGEIIFYEMCEVLEIDRALILEHTKKAGGAQYVLKGVNYQFWNKVETDCEKLFSHLTTNKERYGDIFCKNTGTERSEYRGFQDWCADMWTILWNGLQMGFKIEIDQELDFCWPIDGLDRWEETKILHNSGVTQYLSDTYFYKGGFYNTTPYDIPLDYVVEDKCTIRYVEAIHAFRDAVRTDLLDLTFLLLVRIDSADRLENLHTVTNFLNKHFRTHIILLEADQSSRLEHARLPACVEHIFIQDDAPFLNKARHNNYMVRKATTDLIAIYDVDVICDHAQIVTAVMALRSGEYDLAFPYDGRVISIWEANMKKQFEKKLDIRMLTFCKTVDNSKSWGGAVVLNRKVYEDCGMDNENISKWGPDDIERAKRMEILGCRGMRATGALYHLYHKRGQNSSYASSDDYEQLMQEYIRICNLSREELKQEIIHWPWRTSEVNTFMEANLVL